jgi:Ca2+-binding RTX toxin-like protein
MPTVSALGTLSAVDANNSGLYPLRTVPFREYTVTGLTAGATQIVASANASSLDPYLQIFRRNGTTLTLVADNYDSSPTNKNSLVQFVAEAGAQYVVRIARSSADAGGFNLQITNDASAVIAGPTAVGTADVTVGDITSQNLSFPTFPNPAELASDNGIPSGPSTSKDELSGLPLFYLADSADNANLGVRVETKGFFVSGLNGNDTITGSSDNDFFNGNKGNDALLGGEGVDQIRGGRDSDSIDGGAGNEIILNGNNGNDLVRGGEGNDTVNGGRDSDILFGDNGDDFLSGDFGQDILTGGAGVDSFVLRADRDAASGLTNTATNANQADIITDFVLGTDKIRLNTSDGLTLEKLTFEFVSLNVATAVTDAGALSTSGVKTGTAIKVNDATSAVNGQYLGVVLGVLPGTLNQATNFTVA